MEKKKESKDVEFGDIAGDKCMEESLFQIIQALVQHVKELEFIKGSKPFQEEERLH